MPPWADKRAVPVGPVASVGVTTCWSAKAAVLPRLIDAACKSTVVPAVATKRGASSTMRRTRSSRSGPSNCSASLLRSDSPARPAACNIVASTVALPRSGSSAAASPQASGAAVVGKAVLAAAVLPSRSTTRRSGAPSAWPSPASVRLNWPPAAAASAALALKRPASTPPPGWGMPPGSGLFCSVMSSVPALP